MAAISFLPGSKSPSLSELKRSAQCISVDGKVQVSKKAWTIRIILLAALSLIASNNINIGMSRANELYAFSTLMPLQVLLTLSVGWFFYRNPAKRGEKVGNDLVSVIIPIYNQKEIIEIVIDAIYNSTYQNIEVIAVNDGSKDGTAEILDNTRKKKHPNMLVIHKQNEGKRKAIADGFRTSRGKYIILIDSDSIVEEHAIEEIIKSFNSNYKVGAVAGHTKVSNADKNFLTKCQDAWYDYCFNIRDITESTFGSVMCCPGPLAGYRRETIADFIPYWEDPKILHYSHGDTQLIADTKDSSLHIKSEQSGTFISSTSVTNCSSSSSSYLSAHQPLSVHSQKLLSGVSEFDDGDDRTLTAYALLNWKTVYTSTAIAYTEVPDKPNKFIKQLLRWKKGFIRTNLFVSSFFWSKKLTNPIMSFLYYIDFMMTFMSPLFILMIYFYKPLILHDYLDPAYFLLCLVFSGLIQGIDYRLRNSKSKYWIYQCIMTLLQFFVFTWLLIPALWTINKKVWLTR